MRAFFALLALSLAIAACGSTSHPVSIYPPNDNVTEGGNNGDGGSGHDGHR